MEKLNDLKGFIEKSIKSLKKGVSDCHIYKLSDRLAICVGWSMGYGNEDRGDIIQHPTDKDWGLNVGLKVWTSDFLQCDFDFLNFPYYKNGEVLDLGISIAPNYDPQQVADLMLEYYEQIKDLNITEQGEIVEG